MAGFVYIVCVCVCVSVRRSTLSALSGQGPYIVSRWEYVIRLSPPLPPGISIIRSAFKQKIIHSGQIISHLLTDLPEISDREFVQVSCLRLLYEISHFFSFHFYAEIVLV